MVDLLRHEGEPTVLWDVLSSQLDADRLDYLLRDNLMTGSRYGRYDLAWLLEAMTAVEVDGAPRLAVSGKGVSAAEAYLQARYHMYRHVYFHKVVRAAEGMVKLALQRARELMLSDAEGDVTGASLAVPPGSGSVAGFLTGNRLDAAEFADLDDVSVLGCFKAWSRSGDATLAGLCSGLLDRRLFKTIDLAEHADPQQVAAGAADAVAAAGGDPQYALFYDSPSSAPYARGPQSILVVTPRGTDDLADASPFADALTAGAEQRRPHRLHVHANHLDTALAAVK